MDIQHLTYALEVRNCGSISKAAQRLFMAQPNLSNAIKELERETHTVIFKRTNRGIETTKEGEEFLRHANDIVNQFRALDRIYVEQSASFVKASITTMRSSIICDRLIRYINHLNSQDLFFRIHFREATNEEVIDDVNTGRATIGILRANTSSFDYFCYQAKANQCLVQPVPSSRYTVLMSRDHPLSREDELTLDMLKPYTEVIHGDFEIPWYMYSDAYSSDALEPGAEKVLFVYDRGTLMDCIRNLHGAYSWTISTMPESLEINGLIEKPCKGYDMEGQEAIIYKSSTPLTQKLLDLIAYLSQASE